MDDVVSLPGVTYCPPWPRSKDLGQKSLLPALVRRTKLVGESLRPVWGPMDKCYPVTTQVGKGWGPPGCGALAWAPWVGTERRCSREGPPAAHSCESLSCLLLQRRRVKSEKKPASEAVPSKAKGGLNGAAPEGETDILSQREGETAGPGPAGKEVAEEEEVAGVPGWEVRRRVGYLECSRHRPTEKPRSTAGWRSWEGGQSWGDGAPKTPGPNCHPSGARGPTEPRGSSHGVSQEWV
uniref:uncharacterized protein LOC129511718 isoform X2 n=1 Tax=Nyctereutes procyonoides TaxID=34880 RepID=UPI00244435AF|nr:uncharacterized protein LOC129511718 isoform X2 [Nyctereutes procyonoides]